MAVRLLRVAPDASCTARNRRLNVRFRRIDIRSQRRALVKRSSAPAPVAPVHLTYKHGPLDGAGSALNARTRTRPWNLMAMLEAVGQARESR